MKGLKVILLCVVTVIAVSCKDKDLYDAEIANPTNMEFNSFDFSTVQTVNLSVDYSAFKTYGPVFFSVYSENPFVGEGEEEHLDENISPLFEDYTNANGKFNMNIKLPAYAKHLYIVTGNFLVSDYLIEAEVQNGMAKAVASKPADSYRSSLRAGAQDVQTSNVDNLPQLYNIVDEDGKNTNEQIYKKWFTPLGTWDSKTGTPSYVIDPATLTDKQKDLLFTEEEIGYLYATIGEALDANKTCNPIYRNSPDLTLEKASEVVLTMLGGNTCWNSSLGYYYYMSGNEPTNPSDLNIIMLFPNTQDGEWSKRKSNQVITKGVNRGDAVQLKYYPNIANNGDLSGETTVFPAGIKIGFILKSNAWGMQGAGFGITHYKDSARPYNNWATSTPGASYCRPFGEPGENPYQHPNPNGESRSAKFAYKNAKGEKYAIVSFEDACNDEDYDDVIFALKPINAFTPLPEVENKKTTTFGVYAFEDLWPSRGDYDLNDVVVDFKHEKVMSRQKFEDVEEEFKIYQETFYLTTDQNYVTLTSGLALKLNTTVEPSSIVMRQVDPSTNDTTEVTFRNENNVYYLTDDVKATLGTTFILELNYEVGQISSTLASVQPFIYRDEANNKTWEVHIPFEAPTEKMNLTYFGKQDDTSDPDVNRFFVRDSDYPFAFFLYGAKIEKFKNTILKRENESIKISDLYDDFLKWSVSKGVDCPDWYLHPNK